jgi:hypothetical protein
LDCNDLRVEIFSVSAGSRVETGALRCRNLSASGAMVSIYNSIYVLLSSAEDRRKKVPTTTTAMVDKESRISLPTTTRRRGLLLRDGVVLGYHAHSGLYKYLARGLVKIVGGRHECEAEPFSISRGNFARGERKSFHHHGTGT